MRLDIAGVPGVELGVNQRMQHNFRFIASHDAVPEATAGPGRVVTVSAAFHAARSMARARASCNMTVPTGTPATWAISWDDKLFISRNMIASRNGSGNSATNQAVGRPAPSAGPATGRCPEPAVERRAAALRRRIQ